jgi:hypothetical protein
MYSQMPSIAGGRPSIHNSRMRHAVMTGTHLSFREIAWGGVDWIGVAQVRDKWRALVNAVMNLRVP